MAKLGLILVAACAFTAATLASPTSVVAPTLLRSLKEKGTANVAIVLKSGVSSIYDQAQGKQFQARGDRMTAVKAALIQHTSQTQSSITALLDSQGVSYKSFWITNRIIVPKASLALVQQIVALSEVAEIREEIVVPLEPVRKGTTGVVKHEKAPVRGVWIVKAHEMWAKGINGTGMVVSNIDTGVRGTHTILRNNFLGAYGWYDPNAGKLEPYDDNGHGTHTMGTIAGQDGFGVAPDAKWMACIGCAGSSCYESDLLGCGEFIACPHMADGSNPDCSKAPHVVSNSWGSTAGGQTWYDDVIRGFHTAEVIPVFSAGNAGSGCGTVGSPGDRDVIGVAATDMEDVIAYFSSRGPPVSGSPDMQKPEISAPGVEVLSSVNSGDDDYDRYSGTSMACPHVSGGVALLIQSRPNLAGDYAGVRSALFSGAQKQGLQGSGQSCGGVGDQTFPNMVFGHGRLDLVSSTNVTIVA